MANDFVVLFLWFVFDNRYGRENDRYLIILNINLYIFYCEEIPKNCNFFLTLLRGKFFIA